MSASKGGKSQPRPKPKPKVHGGRPAGGKHVESNVAGEGGYDCSGAIGSNVSPAPGPRQASDEVLSAPPYYAGNTSIPMYGPPTV